MTDSWQLPDGARMHGWLMVWSWSGMHACNDVDERIVIVWLTLREFHVSRLICHVTNTHWLTNLLSALGRTAGRTERHPGSIVHRPLLPYPREKPWSNAAVTLLYIQLYSPYMMVEKTVIKQNKTTQHNKTEQIGLTRCEAFTLVQRHYNVNLLCCTWCAVVVLY